MKLLLGINIIYIYFDEKSLNEGGNQNEITMGR